MGSCWCGGAETEGRCLESEFHDPLSNGRPPVIRKLYVAGPMSGYPENNYPAFNTAASALIQAGFIVINPAQFGGTGGHYVDLLREDLKKMLTCHGVAMLPYWWESAGARNEIQVAGILKMPCRTVEDWLKK